MYTNDSELRNYLLFPRRVFRATWLSCYNTCLSKHDSRAAVPREQLVGSVGVPWARLPSGDGFGACWFDACLTSLAARGSLWLRSANALWVVFAR